ncbi:MAG: 3,4-dihydroxy 2-butanone 4-phosphate synthase/GTP cyclohydrolase II [Cellvibrionaceae bacterium]|jgi:3,4-dihydroxy 2-butanone 4-phosphate synthase/GTP cyclohydrolase II
MTKLATIPEAIEEFRKGKMVIIVDDEDRENEGDLAVAAEFATPEVINFMATHGRGLICTPLEEKICDRMGLPQMVPPHMNGSGFGTPFTLSVEAAQGVSTGISAEDRSHTIGILINPTSIPADIVMPGHVFPLRAQAGGVLERRGQTEASVDLARLAGQTPAAVICEIMSANGTMARLPELIEFGKAHDLVTISIDALAKYRLQIEDTDFSKRMGPAVVREVEASLPTDYGTFTAVVYKDLKNNKEHMLLKMGDVSSNALVRIHSECLTGDILGSRKCDCGSQLELALQKISTAGHGALLYMRQEGRGIGLANKIKAYALQEQGVDTLDANLQLGLPADARDYRVAAEMLKMEQIDTIHLMTNNPEKVIGLEDHGITVEKRIPHEIVSITENDFYLRTKADRMGHILSFNGSAQKVTKNRRTS